MRKLPMTKERLINYRVIVDECWLWLGSKDSDGYGRVKYLGSPRSVHRMAYELWNGSPGDLFVLHKCDTPACFNPEHLFLGTQTDNMHDMSVKKRGRNGNLKGENHPMVKLSDRDVTNIINDTRSQYVIAKDYNITQAHVSNLKRGKRRR